MKELTKEEFEQAIKKANELKLVIGGMIEDDSTPHLIDIMLAEVLSFHFSFQAFDNSRTYDEAKEFFFGIFKEFERLMKTKVEEKLKEKCLDKGFH